MPTYAADLVVRVRDPRHLQHVFNGLKNQAVQIDPNARVYQLQPNCILASLVIDQRPQGISEVADMVSRYESFLERIELHVLTPYSDELLRMQLVKCRSVSELMLSEITIRLLKAADILTVFDLTKVTKRHLKLFVEGIGPLKIQEIEDALALEGLSLSNE